MTERTPRTASGATILDLHSIRAGLAGNLAALDQAEALRRQRVGLSLMRADGAGICIGDKFRHPETGEVGTLIEVLSSGYGVLQFRGLRLAVRLEVLERGRVFEDTVELPSDCEASL